MLKLASKQCPKVQLQTLSSTQESKIVREAHNLMSILVRQETVTACSLRVSQQCRINVQLRSSLRRALLSYLCGSSPSCLFRQDGHQEGQRESYFQTTGKERNKKSTSGRAIFNSSKAFNKANQEDHQGR
ncbi:uncharacterized protein DS421_17g577160 [Arachis hypogaea]|nr:uncharacterized protein DS421_17g577160 [Arachis hypogaea]